MSAKLTNIDTLAKNFADEDGKLHLKVKMSSGKKYVTDKEGSALFPLRVDGDETYAKATKLVVDKTTGEVLSAIAPEVKNEEKKSSVKASTNGCAFGTTILK